MNNPVFEAIISGHERELRGKFSRTHFHFSEETGSTNDDLLHRVRSGKAQHLEVISTDFQRQGRGRRGDKWEASAGQNLLFSIALELVGPRSHWTRLPHLTAFLLGQSVESILIGSQKLQAKWPNDLLHHGKKLAGILVETVLTPQPFAVVGIGLNVNLRTVELPAELQNTATSLYEILECESNRWFLLGEIIAAFATEYPDKLTNFSEVIEWLRTRDALRNQSLKILTQQGPLYGTGAGIGDNGELLLEREDQSLKTILSAERVLLC
ncbi:MAG: biotin--[acetyl-CoA-carboxylase] ligase [Verrucomicrobiota bacterium]